MVLYKQNVHLAQISFLLLDSLRKQIQNLKREKKK